MLSFTQEGCKSLDVYVTLSNPVPATIWRLFLRSRELPQGGATVGSIPLATRCRYSVE